LPSFFAFRVRQKMMERLSGLTGFGVALLAAWTLSCSDETNGVIAGGGTAAGASVGGTGVGGSGAGGGGSGSFAGSGVTPSGGVTSSAAGSGGGGAGGSVGVSGAAGTAGGGGASGVFGQLACPQSTGQGDGVHQTVDMPPPEWQLAPGTPRGKVTQQGSIESQVYGGYDFPYRVYTSPNYVPGEPALLLLFGDGGMYLGDGYHTPTVLDNLTNSGALLPTVALFVDPGADRVGTYDPPTDKYARFVTEELIPQVITGKYSVSLDPNAWATVGYSASGEAGFAVVWHRPEQFHAFFGHSASFGASIRYDDWVWADKIASSPKRELRVSLVVAAQGDLTDDRGSWRTINENVAAALAAKGNPYRLIIGPGDHGGLASQQDFPNALRWMWAGCQFR
jgi:enterochelin esterase family protein